jgi:hypothetical protein
MAKFNKERLIFGVFLLVLIIIIDLILHHFHLPTWPAFMVMIFFFEAHMDVKKASHIVVGGMVGILCFVLTGLFVKAFAPLIGLMTARLFFICLVVYAIVAFGEILPMVFNNYAFMFYLISGLAATVMDPAPNPWLWIGLDVIGGILVILGIVGIGKLMAVLLSPGSKTS